VRSPRRCNGSTISQACVPCFPSTLPSRRPSSPASANDHHPVRRESANLNVGFCNRLGQRQVESFHRPHHKCHCLRIPTFVDPERRRATSRYPIKERSCIGIDRDVPAGGAVIHWAGRRRIAWQRPARSPRMVRHE
jgi:hypothetical protein